MNESQLSKKIYRTIVLLVLDGFGISNEKYGNPIYETPKPNLDFIEKKFPFTTLQASGTAVGLPWGESGNSEVGHLTIGAGTVVYHHLPRIVSAIQDQSFFSNEALVGAAEHVKTFKTRCHIIGLVSSGSVHSYIDHFYALFEFVKLQQLPEVFLHIITDGKDAPPNEGGKFIPQIEERLKKLYPNIKIASIIGRTFAMDRDERWDRIKSAYQLFVNGTGTPITIASEYVNDSYKKEVYDSFIEPAFIADISGKPVGTIQDGDAVIFSNFREDSMREITEPFIKDSFDKFPHARLMNLYIATMTEYSKMLRTHVAFPSIEIKYPLARVISEAGMRQLHTAETEKYAHVTYFFNGGNETRHTGEEWELIRSIATARYDEAPRMRTHEITDLIIQNLPTYQFILANFANADMVGHTGNYEAIKNAITSIDEEIGRITEAVLNTDSTLIITGDHGNAELKISKTTGAMLTEHTNNPVPFYLIGKDFILKNDRPQTKIKKMREEIGGVLTDISPTIIELFGLRAPSEMIGKNLLPLLIKQIDENSSI
ncbi:MAG: 2,3-bisphosphoglycerate-independent phosphoglycerate mutase [Patescibacteria group bacterium]